MFEVFTCSRISQAAGGDDKDCLLIADGIRNGPPMQILERQGKIQTNGFVIQRDSEHSAPRAVRLQPAPTKSANKPVAVSRA